VHPLEFSKNRPPREGSGFASTKEFNSLLSVKHLRLKKTKGTTHRSGFLALEVHLRSFGLFRSILFTLGGVMGDEIVILWSRELKSDFLGKK